MHWWSLRRLLAEHGREVFPRWWVAGALAVSGAAGTWGWRVGGHDFLVNLLASLTLLGPGLFLVHVVAERWQEDRDWDRVSAKITSSIDQVVDIVYGALCSPAEVLQLQRFRFHWRADNPSDDPRGVDLQPLSIVIHDLRDLSAECRTWCRALDQGRAESLMLTLPEMNRMLSCASALERALAPLDPSVSIHSAQLRLNLLEDHVHSVGLTVVVDGTLQTTAVGEIPSLVGMVAVAEESLHAWVAECARFLAGALEEVQLAIVRAAPPGRIRHTQSPSSPGRTPVQRSAPDDDLLAHEILTSPR